LSNGHHTKHVGRVLAKAGRSAPASGKPKPYKQLGAQLISPLTARPAVCNVAHVLRVMPAAPNA